MIPAVVATGLVPRLRREGVEHLHFYTSDRAEPSYAIWHAPEMRPATPSRSAGNRVPTVAVL
jgi:5,10-methylenetetrahydrofolate reductase